MDRLGPWDSARRVAVAVSGGADSLALVLLAAGWGDPLALIVDHGLRPASAGEAEHTRAALAARGITSRVLTLRGLTVGPGLPARARAARYDALESATAAAGLLDLLLGHQAADQAETVVMRGRRGSGPTGLAGMAALIHGRSVRRVRPLLGWPPGRLRATVQAAGLGWVDDPTNTDPRFTRARVRAELDGDCAALGQAATHAAIRARSERAVAETLARRAMLSAAGYALLTPGPIAAAALAALIRMISGRAYPPPTLGVAALARELRPATLGGVEIRPAGRMGPGWLLVREASAMAAPAPLAAGAVWDGRFRVVGMPAQGYRVGALGEGSAAFRRSGLPASVLRTLPAIYGQGGLAAVPILAFAAPGEHMSATIMRHCASPACDAPFQA